MELSSYSYSSRQRYRPRKKRIRLKLLLISLLLTTLGYTVYALRQPLPQPSLEISVPSLVAEKVDLNWPGPGIGAVGSLNEGILATEAETTPRPIASITKVVTALMVMKAKPLSLNSQGPNIPITQKDVDSYNSYLSQYGSVAKVELNQQLSQYHALQALMLPSANNIADTLAIWAYGSMDNYVAKANEFVRANGLSGTTIADASGFSANTKSIPADLIKLGELLLKDEVLSQIVKQREALIPITGLVKTTNDLLSDGSVIGIKTGNTIEAGGCLLFAATVSGPDNQTKTIIGAVLGEDTKASSISASRILLASIKQGFRDREVIKANQYIGTIKTAWGSQAKVKTSERLSVFSWQGNEIKPEVEVNKLNSINKNTEVGKLKIANINDEQVILLAEDVISPAPLSWRLTQPIRNLFANVFTNNGN